MVFTMDFQINLVPNFAQGSGCIEAEPETKRNPIRFDGEA
jgi:hypothetical protein